MSGYFSNFSLDKLTNTISSAAHKTQDKLSTAIANIQLDDPQAKLSLKVRKHYLQETLGAIDDISKLPPQYQFLEKKCDSLEKICRRMLVVTKTFEVEGYDYPPNLSESISDWWGANRSGLLSFMDGKKGEGSKAKAEEKDENEGFLPRSFAQALSKAAKDSGDVLRTLKDERKEPPQDEDEDEEEDINSLITMFEAWSKCEQKIDQEKAEMDSLMAKEFNKKLDKLINEDFKKVHSLRKKVEDSRLKFDTLRYELNLKEKEQQKAKAKEEENEKVDVVELNAPEEKAKTEGQETSEGEEHDLKADEKPSEDTASKIPESVENAEVDKEDPEHKLLEKLEDEFVSSTTEAVEIMGEITDSSEILSLVKLFHKFQLIYHRQCVQELEASTKILDGLDNE